LKTAIVTGAGGGLGAAIAETLSAAGWRTGILDVARDKAEAVAARIANAQPLTANVADEAAMRTALNAFGAIPDLLVNNAGIVRFGPFLDQSLDDLRQVIEVNLMGVIVPSWLVGRGMAERGSGTIINIASISGTVGAVNVGAYGPTKAAIANLTQLLAVELGPRGVRVNAIAPGLINAGMGAEKTYGDPARFEARSRAIPVRRQGAAEDIANVVLFMASDAASYVNGQLLLVDGGLSASLLTQLPGGKRS
jgi:NAD(P)-dependent dehydrogenase (short-subunit alcohol dehydrogenase family)